MCVIAFIFAVLSTAWASDQQAATPAAVPYLLRMERLQSDQDLCVLVRDDGQYHVERLRTSGVRLFEGKLRDGALASLNDLLTKDELLHLQQSDIAASLTTQNRDQIFVSVLRSTHWQNLEFDSAASRKPYEEFLDPLLKWLDDLPKEKAKELTEESGRNNCLPSKEITLQTRSAGQMLSPNSQSPERNQVSAQEVRPNFTGRWKLNLNKSELTKQPARGDHLCIIKHVEPRLEIKVQDYTYRYVTDGKVHVAFRGMLDPDLELQMAKTYWDGNTLVIETSQEIGPGGTRWVTRYRLEDKNTLVVTEHHSQSKFGSAFDEYLIYEKQK